MCGGGLMVLFCAVETVHFALSVKQNSRGTRPSNQFCTIEEKWNASRLPRLELVKEAYKPMT